MKDVCSATLEEGHKHGIVRTPQEEGEALGREEVKSIVLFSVLTTYYKDQQSSIRSSLNLGEEHQLLEGASKLLNKKYLLSTHCGCSMFTDLLKLYSDGGDLIDTII